jgi:hypothetical protein
LTALNIDTSDESGEDDNADDVGPTGDIVSAVSDPAKIDGICRMEIGCDGCILIELDRQLCTYYSPFLLERPTRRNDDKN